MFLIAAAALATASTPASATSATARATATIRIVAAVRLKLDGSANPGAPAARDSVIRQADGTSQPVKLIEFQ